MSGRYWKRRQVLEPNPQAHDLALQEGLLGRLAELSGVPLRT